MRIVAVRECAVPLKSDLRNSSIDFSEMTTSVVAVVTDVVRDGKPVAGFAFSGENFEPANILACMMQREKSGGHSERSIAIGTIEVAVWDAVAKIAGKPLHQLLAERYNGGKIATNVFCYVGGGWYRPGQTVTDLQDEMRRHLDAGYTMVKMKVGGMLLDEDVRRVEAVKKILPAGAELAVDANSKFSRDKASTQDVENLVRFGGLRPDRDDVIQIDPPQAYGIVQYARTVDMLAGHGWPRRALFPHGGNQMSLAIAGGFGLGGAESYPGVFGAFGGFADDARLAGGYLPLSDRPGIGFEGQSALHRIMRELAA